MGYKKIFNRTTLQLIIPLSTMTKTEYKETYGIDLDSIDFEKVTLLQEDGDKNKYYVDEVKETENGVDIYAGGKILSIGSSVSVVDNAYSVANSKPIYIHPLHLFISNVMRITCLIFNNDSTPFTWYTFKSWLLQAGSESSLIKIMASGAFKSGDNIAIASYIVGAGTQIQAIGVSVAGDFNYSLELTNLTISLEDGVNKIN